MQVIEKVKVVPEGYNGAGIDGMYGRRDVNGKANAGLTLGIIGTALALQGGLYQWALNQQNQRFQDRQVIDGEMFGLYKSQIDADFSLYKGQRDNYDALKTQIEELKTQVAVGAAIRPYQDKLIQCEIERAFTAGINYVDKKTCNVIYGVTCLPNEPTTTGLVGRNANGCLPYFDFSIPVLGNGNISNGNITISIPFINKGIMFNQSDLETFRQLLTK